MIVSERVLVMTTSLFSILLFYLNKKYDS